MREARGGQKPASFPFGMLGFAKPVLLGPWKGQRRVLCCYLGMRYVTGGGVFVFPVNPDSNGNREVIRCHSFRIREGVQFDVNAVWPLLAGVRPNDPNLAPPFVDPRETLSETKPNEGNQGSQSVGSLILSAVLNDFDKHVSEDFCSFSVVEQTNHEQHDDVLPFCLDAPVSLETSSMFCDDSFAMCSEKCGVCVGMSPSDDGRSECLGCQDLSSSEKPCESRDDSCMRFSKHEVFGVVGEFLHDCSPVGLLFCYGYLVGGHFVLHGYGHE